MNRAGIAKALTKIGHNGPTGKEVFAKGEFETALEAFRHAFT